MSAWFERDVHAHLRREQPGVLGLFTRPIVRGTPNSNRARLATTRFVSSASVTAATTWAVLAPAASSTSGSVPLPATTALGRQLPRQLGEERRPVARRA